MSYPPGGPHQPPPTVQYVVHVPQKSGGVAAILEVVFGLFFQTFGIGHMYAGNVVFGLLAMFGYWVVLGVNIVLLYFAIGWCTLPACWIGMLIFSPIIAASSCKGR